VTALGLEDLVTTVEARVAVTILIAVLAFSGAYLVGHLRRQLAEYFSPIAVDLVGSVLSIMIVVAAVVSVADLWGESGVIGEQLGASSFEERAPRIAVTIVVLVGVYVFTSIARRLLDDITQESEAMSEHERELAYRVTQILLWAVGLLVVLGVWEVNLGGLLIGAGFLGIVVGLAARQTLASMLAGLVLMFSRPFEVGDWIAIGEGNQEAEGIVTDVTLMNTRIQGFDGEFVMVPNEVIGSRMIRNRSRKGRLRIQVDVGIDYQADVDRAREVATEAVGEIDMIMEVPRPETVTVGFDDSAVTLGVRGWIERPSSRRRWRARTRMTRSVKEAFAEAGIKIPFPQRELTGRVEEGGFRLAEEGEGRRGSPSQEGGGPAASQDSDEADTDGSASGQDADESDDSADESGAEPASEDSSGDEM